jgi:hypothetical protein
VLAGAEQKGGVALKTSLKLRDVAEHGRLTRSSGRAARQWASSSARRRAPGRRSLVPAHTVEKGVSKHPEKFGKGASKASPAPVGE